MESRKLPTVDELATQLEVNKNTITHMVKLIKSAVQTEFNLLVRITDEVTKDG
jgi:DNA-binding transcriptional regulator YhcF (GntR family)